MSNDSDELHKCKVEIEDVRTRLAGREIAKKFGVTKTKISKLKLLAERYAALDAARGGGK